MATVKNTKKRTEAEIQAMFAKANGKGKPGPVEFPGDMVMAAQQPAEIAQLPPWAEALRCLPNEIVRSALFNARNRKQARLYIKKTEIVVIGDGRITYQGEELRQDDLTAWLQLIHLAKEQPLGKIVEFTPYSFCKTIGWPICKGSYERLRACLDRMQATSLAVYSKRLKEGVSLSMIPVFAWQDDEKQTLKKYRVQVAPQLVELFGDVNYTHLEWSQRLALPDGIATWLHGYFASHSQPFPIKIATIKTGSGMTTESTAKVRQLIEKALNALKEVGFLSSWEILGELVHVKRIKYKP
jgi:TrfA protein